MIPAFIIATWAAIAATIYFVEFTRIHLRIRIRKAGNAGRQQIGHKDGTDSRYWYPLNRKPFNCEACLPFWLMAAFLGLAIYRCEAVAFIASACTAGIITPLIINRIRK